MSPLKVKTGVARHLTALLSLWMGCAYAARVISIPISSANGGGSPAFNDLLKLHEFAKPSRHEVPTLNGLPTEFCRPCLQISRKAKEILSDPNLFQDVDYLAGSFCHILPPGLHVKCAEAVELHKHEAVMFLQDEFIEEKFCYSTGFCTDMSEKSPLSPSGKAELLTAMEPLIKLLNKFQKRLNVNAASGLVNTAKTFTLEEIPAELRSNGTCAACHSVLDKVRNDLQDPDKQMKIITSLLKACEVEVFVYRCKKLVFTYGPLVISNVQKIVGMDLCRMVHLCDDPRNQTTSITDPTTFQNSGVHIQSAVAPKLHAM